jgi:hypothetical protein
MSTEPTPPRARLPAPRARSADADLVRLVAGALARDDGAGPSPGAETHRARAEALLHDYAFRHFATQIETLRRDAVIAHLAAQARDRMRFGRLLAIAATGALIAIGLAEAARLALDAWGLDASWLAAAAPPWLRAAATILQ